MIAMCWACQVDWSDLNLSSVVVELIMYKGNSSWQPLLTVWGGGNLFPVKGKTNLLYMDKEGESSA